METVLKKIFIISVWIPNTIFLLITLLLLKWNRKQEHFLILGSCCYQGITKSILYPLIPSMPRNVKMKKGGRRNV